MKKAAGDPNAFARGCTIAYVLILLGAAAALVWALKSGGEVYGGLALVFALGAAANTLHAFRRFRRDEYYRRHILSGIGFCLIGLLLLGLSLVCMLCTAG